VFTAIIGSVSISRQKAMNSSVPKSLCSTPGPGGILARRTAVAVADAVAPVVAADEIAARPAIDRAVELLEQRQRVGAHAATLSAGISDGGPSSTSPLKTRISSTPLVSPPVAGGEGEFLLRVFVALEREPFRGAVVRAVAPGEATSISARLPSGLAQR
jgi:hypothetical protein